MVSTKTLQEHPPAESFLSQIVTEALSAKKIEIDNAAAKALKANQEFEDLVANELGKISLPIPPGLEKSEKALGSVDVNKSWDEYAERVLEEVREFETWRQSRQKTPNSISNSTATIKPLESDTKINQLQSELKSTRWQNHQYEAELAALKAAHEEALKTREPLVQVGIAIRRRFLESVKREKRGSSGSSSSTGGDEVLVERGNRAAHCGNIAADSAMFALGILTTIENIERFRDFYRVRPKIYSGKCWPTRVEEIHNMRGTVESCQPRVQNSSLSQDLRDRFHTHEYKAFVIFLRYRGGRSLIDSSVKQDIGHLFDADSEVQQACAEMQKITEEMVKLARKRA